MGPNSTDNMVETTKNEITEENKIQKSTNKKVKPQSIIKSVNKKVVASKVKSDQTISKDVFSSELSKDIKIIITKEDIQISYNQELSNLQKEVVLPGFRKGKVPLNLLTSKFKPKIVSKVLEHKVKESIEKELKKYDVYSQEIKGQANIEKYIKEMDLNKELSFSLHLILKPTISKIDLTKIEMEYFEIDKIEDNSITEYIDNNLKEYLLKNPHSNKDKISEGDIVFIDAHFQDKDGELNKKAVHLSAVINKDDQFVSSIYKKFIDLKLKDKKEISLYLNDKINMMLDRMKIKTKYETVKMLFEVKAICTSFNNLDNKSSQEIFGLNVKDLKAKAEKMLQRRGEVEARQINQINLFNILETQLDFVLPQAIFEKEYNAIRSKLTNIVSKEDLDSVSKRYAARRSRIAFYLEDYLKNNQVQDNLNKRKEFLVNRLITEGAMDNLYNSSEFSIDKIVDHIGDTYMKNNTQVMGLYKEHLVCDHILHKKVILTIKKISDKELERVFVSLQKKYHLL